MRRDPRAYLWDVREAADAIASFTSDVDKERYSKDPLIRSAVERQLEIIGEALNRLSAVDRALADQIPECRQAIGLRNVLIHGYAIVNDTLVWKTVRDDIPVLRGRVATLLENAEK